VRSGPGGSSQKKPLERALTLQNRSGTHGWRLSINLIRLGAGRFSTTIQPHTTRKPMAKRKRMLYMRMCETNWRKTETVQSISWRKHGRANAIIDQLYLFDSTPDSLSSSSCPAFSWECLVQSFLASCFLNPIDGQLVCLWLLRVAPSLLFRVLP
jgi:hypothetical protein